MKIRAIEPGHIDFVPLRQIIAPSSCRLRRALARGLTFASLEYVPHVYREGGADGPLVSWEVQFYQDEQRDRPALEREGPGRGYRGFIDPHFTHGAAIWTADRLELELVDMAIAWAAETLRFESPYECVPSPPPEYWRTPHTAYARPLRRQALAGPVTRDFLAMVESASGYASIFTTADLEDALRMLDGWAFAALATLPRIEEEHEELERREGFKRLGAKVERRPAP